METLQAGGVLESSGPPLDDGHRNFNIDASWAEKLMKTRVSFLAAPTVVVVEQQGVDKSKVWVSLISHVHVLTTYSHCSVPPIWFLPCTALTAVTISNLYLARCFHFPICNSTSQSLLIEG